MASVVTALPDAILREMPPCVNTGSQDIRVFKIIAFGEENSIRRVIAFAKAFAPAIKHIMLPWRHPAPGALRVKQTVALTEKTVPAGHNQAAEEVFWVK